MAKNDKIAIASAIIEQKDIAALIGSVDDLKTQMSELVNLVKGLQNRREYVIDNIRFSRSDLEEILKVSKNTVYNWRDPSQPNPLPYYCDEGSVYYLYSDVYTWIKKGYISASSEKRAFWLNQLRSYQFGYEHGQLIDDEV